MSTTFNWQFESFERAPLVGDLVDVVRVIHWRLNAADADYRTSAYGTATLPDPDEDNFTDFDDITKQWAIDAVSSVIDVPAIEASLEAQIGNMKAPSVISTLPPFDN